MGYSTDTFYRYRDAVDDGGMEALLEKSRKRPNVKNRVDETIEKAVTEFPFEWLAYVQTRASNELRKAGVFVSPSGVRNVWLRHTLSL